MPKRSYIGELTLSNVTQEAPPKITHGASVDLTQFVEIVENSYSRFKAGVPQSSTGVTVPSEAVTLVKSRFTNAAKTLEGVGVSFEEIPYGSKRAAEYGLTTGQSRLIVQARDKKKTGPRAKVQPVNAAVEPSTPQPPKPGARGKR